MTRNPFHVQHMCNLKKYLGVQGDSSDNRVLAVQAFGRPRLIPKNPYKEKLSMIACICNFHSEGAKTGGYLGLPGQPTWPTWSVPGQWEKKIKSGMHLRTDFQGSLTFMHMHTYIHVNLQMCTHKHGFMRVHTHKYFWWWSKDSKPMDVEGQLYINGLHDCPSYFLSS